MRMPRFLGLLVPVVALVACGGPTSADVVDVNDASDVAVDVPVADVVDAIAVTDATDAVDIAQDVPPMVSFISMVHVTMLSQNCMPIIASDPMTLTGSVDVTNSGGVAIGPITASDGIIVHEDGTELGRFTIAPISISAIAPGANGTAMLTKNGMSLTPANGCSTVPCSAPVRVEIPISGPNIPPNTRAISAITIVTCTM